jgi:hypothetical protein
MLESKKFKAAVGAAGIAAWMTLGGTEAELKEILVVISPLLTYIGAQGIADHGKEATKAAGEYGMLGVVEPTEEPPTPRTGFTSK